MYMSRFFEIQGICEVLESLPFKCMQLISFETAARVGELLALLKVRPSVLVRDNHEHIPLRNPAKSSSSDEASIGSDATVPTFVKLTDSPHLFKHN